MLSRYAQHLAGLASPVLLTLRLAPRRTIAITLASLFVALLESVGLMALVPLIILLGRGDTGAGGTNQIIERLSAYLPFQIDLRTVVAAIVLLLISKSLLRYVVDTSANVTASRLMHAARRRLASSYLSAQWTSVREISYGQIASISSDGVVFGIGGLYNATIAAMSTALQVLAYAALLLIIDARIAIAGMLTMLALVAMLAPLHHGHHVSMRRLIARYASITTLFVDMSKTAKSSIAMQSADQVQALVSAESRHAWRDEHRSHAFLSASTALIEPTIALFVIGLALALSMTNYTPALIVLVVVAFLRLMMMLAKLQSQVMSLNRFRLNVDRYETFVSELEAAREATSGTKVVNPSRNISLVDVTVLTEHGRPVLNRVSLELPPSSFVSIIGASGSGKTTLVDCILGLRPTHEGSVAIDNTPISEIDLAALRRQIGYVQQSTLFFNGSIRENLALFSPDAGDEEIWQALDAACAGEFTRALPDGLNARLSEGGAPLSGGQCQRLSIARALLRRPRLLVLDEAASALDPATTEQLYRSISLARDGMTVLAISHETQATRVADLIVSLADGRIVDVHQPAMRHPHQLEEPA